MFSRCGFGCLQERFEDLCCQGVLHGQFELLEEMYIASDRQQLLDTLYPKDRVGMVVVLTDTGCDTEPMNRSRNTI